MMTWLLACAERPSAVADRLVAALPPSARVVQRVAGRRPVVVVVDVPSGDPRASGQRGAAEVVRVLLDAGATGARLASGDGADELARSVGSDRVHVLPGGDEGHVLAMRRVTALVAEPLSPFALSRDLVVAGIAPADAVRAWQALREDGLARYDLAEGLLAETGAHLAATALAEDGPVVLGVPGPAAPTTVAELQAAGATLVHVRPGDLGGLPDLDLWRAGLRAGLPATVPPEGDLPSLAGWMEALRPHAAAVARWEDREEVRRAILAEVGGPPAELPPADPRRAAVTEAARRLQGQIPVLPDPEALLATVRLCDRPKPGTAMSYDALFDAIKVGDWVLELDPDLVAVVLAHELVHAHDAHGAAASLGTDPAGWALLLDTLPLGVGASVTLATEDRAYRVEAGLLDALGDGLPSAAEAERIRSDREAPPPDVLRSTLAALHATPVGTVEWLQLVSDLTPLPTRTP